MSVSGASCVAALMSSHVAPRVKSVFDVFSQIRSRIYECSKLTDSMQNGRDEEPGHGKSLIIIGKKIDFSLIIIEISKKKFEKNWNFNSLLFYDV